MIPRSRDWKNALAEMVRDPAELLALLELPRDLLPQAREAAKQFPLRVPRGYIGRMAKGDPADPLLRQVLPLGEELDPVEGFSTDPVGDSAATAAPGLLHKYHGRALLVVTGACAIHCRYCFRRHYAYGENNPLKRHWPQVRRYLIEHPEISELILSGGDPLLLETEQLQWLGEELASLRQIKRLRLHTRLPIVLPERIDRPLLEWLEQLPLQRVVVVHANHPQELDGEVGKALHALTQSGTTLLNQTVLLKGINDEVEPLVELSETLFANQTLPYYLHRLDRVAGAAHFDLPEQRVRELYRSLRNRLPGYLVPQLVKEVAGEPAKSPLI